SQAPELLFNIGQCYRNLGRYEEATKSYQAFLRVTPNAPNRAKVEALIAEMEAAREKQPKEASPAPGAPPEPHPAASGEGAPQPPITPAPSPDKPRGARAPSIYLLGGAAAAAAAGLALG